MKSIVLDFVTLILLTTISSLFTHVIADVRISILFKPKIYYTVFIAAFCLLVIHQWILSFLLYFQVLLKKMLAMFTCVQFSSKIAFNSLGVFGISGLNGRTNFPQDCTIGYFQ